MSVDNATTVLPKELNLSDTAIKTLQNGKQIVFEQPSGSSYGPNAKIEIPFARGTTCMENSYLTFFAQTNGNGAGTYNRFSSPITSIFRQITVEWGSTTVADVQGADLLTSIIDVTENSDWYNNEGFLLAGIMSAANRQTLAINGSTYAVDLSKICTLLRAKLLPLEASTVFKITLYLNGTGCLETDNAAASFTISDIQYRHHLYTTLPTEYKDKLKAAMGDGKGMCLNYETWSNFNAAITGANITVTYPPTFKSYTGNLAVMRDSADINNPASDNKYTRFKLNNISNWNHKINNKMIPAAGSIQGVLQSYKELKKCMGKGGMQSTNYPMYVSRTYGDTMFIMGADFSQSERNQSEDMGRIINGLDLSQTAANAQMNIVLGSALANPTQLDMFMRYNASVYINSAGYITLEK